MTSTQHVNQKIEEVTETNIESILCNEEARRAKTPWIYRVIGRMAAFCGTVSFLMTNALIFVIWIAFNETVVKFDPYPFTFLLFVVSLEAIFLSIMILISQNLSSSENERRHHLDLQMNLLSERETTALLRLVLKIAEKLEIQDEDQIEVREFAHMTDPTAVLSQIISAERKHGSPDFQG